MKRIFADIATRRKWPRRHVNHNLYSVNQTTSFAAARILRRMLFLSFLIASVSVAHAAFAQSLKFTSAASYPGGQSPRALAPGDFNGDGKLDLAVANSLGNDVTILRGKGDGTFEQAGSFAVGTKPWSITSGDFNHDGKPDLATVNIDSENVSVLIGNGDGTFKPAVNYPILRLPWSIIAADFNADHNLDLAVTDSGSVSVLLGNSNGTFQSAVNYPVGAGTQGLAAGDFNRDGKLDIVTAINTGGVSALLGNGDGTFQKAVTSTGVEQPSPIAAADFNRDGKLDVAVGVFAGGVGPGIRVMLGNGDGSFQPPSFSFRLDNTPTDIRLGDFNGDGYPDIVSAGIFRGNNLQILLGKGDGTFQDAGSQISGVGGLSVGVADFNRDTRPDVSIVVDSQVSVVLINATPGNPENAKYFVHQHYMDFLDREPDVGGFDYWTGEIGKCGADAQCLRDRRVAVSDAFFFEPEFQQAGAYLYRVFKAAFGQRLTYAQYIADRSRISAGEALNQSKLDFNQVFAGRAEFLTLYPRSLSAAQFVDALLNSIRQNSGVDLSAQRSALINLYDETDLGRAAILKQLADNQTFIDAEYNSSFVLMEYFSYLRRDPEPDGFSFWLDKVNKFPLRDVGVQHAMACSFITSAEYQLRFSSAVTRTNKECPQ